MRRSLPCAPIGSGKDGHASLAHAGQVRNSGFEVGRVDVDSAADDEVFCAAGEEQLARGEVAEVAGVQPVAGEQRGVGRRVLVVPVRRRRPAELDPALRAFGKLVR